jgi:sugar transferase EpsL
VTGAERIGRTVEPDPDQGRKKGLIILKRAFDLLISVVLIVALSPAFLILAVLVRWRLGSPILFSQVRPGRDGRPFTLIKFRSMTNARDEDGDLLPDRERMTSFGRFLRVSSLDELPELWNVLKGDMSLVGPRPLLMRYLDRYTPDQARRHEAKPGMTGWAQVNGRNAISWEERFALDVWYVDNQSFLLDLKILMMTAWQVVRPGRARWDSASGSAEFMGSGRDPDEEDAG